MIGKARVASSKIQDACRSFRRPVRIGYGDAHHVYTLERVAGDLGASEELIQELPHDLQPEHGVIRVHGPMMNGILAFADNGIEEIELPRRDGRTPEMKVDVPLKRRISS